MAEWTAGQGARVRQLSVLPAAIGFRLAVAISAAVTVATPAGASERGILGWSHVIVNDSIGEFRDRWQSSYVHGSVFLGPQRGDLGEIQLGEILEVRLSSQIATPENLTFPRPDDRPFAGALGVELLTHGSFGAVEASLGAGLVAVGPQTATFRVQRRLHEILGFPLPRPEGREIGDAVYPVISAEIGRSFGSGTTVRPFAEARAGIEDLLRVGIDISWGAGGETLYVRDPVTGHRAPGLWLDAPPGWRVFAGADAAWVGGSRLLPAAFGPAPVSRARLRAGAEWRAEEWAVFYGLTYLTPEFEGQREGQFLGAFQLRLNF